MLVVQRGQAGGNALQVDGSVAVTLVNNGTIKAGGGGGGTGGTGGKGVYTGSATFSSLVDEGGGLLEIIILHKIICQLG